MKKSLIGIAITCILMVTTGAHAVVKHAWSEYPSWSVYGVAELIQIDGKPIIDGAEGKRGYVEDVWNVDIENTFKDYDGCLQVYSTGVVDSVNITNLDILSSCQNRKSVVYLLTSTSFGADAVIVQKHITDLEQLRTTKTGVAVKGLRKTVTEQMYRGCLRARNVASPLQFKMENLDPAEAAKNIIMDVQNGGGPKTDHQAIGVWNPFTMTTLIEGQKYGVHVLCDSTEIPGEIIDMGVMSLEKAQTEEGQRAMCALAHAYYLVCQQLANPATQERTLVQLAEKFSRSLDAKKMETVVRQTRFYATPEEGITTMTGGIVFPWQKTVADTSTLFNGKGFDKGFKGVTTKTLKDIMEGQGGVVDFALSIRLIEPGAPLKIHYGQFDANAHLSFDPQFMQRAANKLGK